MPDFMSPRAFAEMVSQTNRRGLTHTGERYLIENLTLMYGGREEDLGDLPVPEGISAEEARNIRSRANRVAIRSPYPFNVDTPDAGS